MKRRRTLSLDLRERILASYDEGDCTRTEVATRFRVSLGMVKKLIQQRRHSGDIAHRHRLAGRKPSMTLEELRSAVALDCTVQAIHIVLGKMGLTFKKRHSAPANKIGPTSHKPVHSGKNSKASSTRCDSSSLMNRVPKRT
jgi:transposase